MKTIKILLSILFGGEGFGFCYDIGNTNFGITTAKYTFDGKPVWSDAEKQNMLKYCMDTGTGCLKDSDFIPVVISTTDQAIIDEMNSQPSVWNRERAIAEIARRNSAEYVNLKNKLVELFGDSYFLSTATVKIDPSQFVDKGKKK